MSDLSHYYTILEVSPQASFEEIKKAFRRLALQYHPDLNPHDPQAAARFKDIYKAYEILSDPQKRSQYDQGKSVAENGQPTAQEYYVEGVRKSLIGHYQAAINSYSQAIALQPDFLEAYLQRCEAYFKQRSYPEVLEDCYQILKLDAQSWQAYYYQGRVRKKLGYLEAAIEAYTKSFDLNPQNAKILYHRGFAYQELKLKKLATQDFLQAANLYQKQGHYRGYRAALHELKAMNSAYFLTHWGENLGINALVTPLKLILTTGVSLFLNPSGEILPKFSQLTLDQRVILGMVYGGLGEFLLLLLSSSLPLLGFTFFAVLTLWMVFLNLIFYGRLSLPTSLFIGGVISLSFSLLVGIGSFFSVFPLFLTLCWLIGVGCSSFLLIYNSFTQILNFSEQKSTYLTALTLTISMFLYLARLTL